MLAASAAPFRAAVSLIKARLLAETALASDETGVRVGRANWWLWVFHHGECAVFVAAARRSRAVVKAFLGGHRPAFWTSDRCGAQASWATKGHQACLAHLIRDVQYAIDAGDTVLNPGLKGLLKRACAIGRRRADLKDATLKGYGLVCRPDRLLALDPTHPAGLKLRRMIRKARSNLFVFVQNRHLEPTNNGSESAAALRGLLQDHQRLSPGMGRSSYADIRSVIETARRRSFRAIDAIRCTLKGEPLHPRTPASA